ncbi:hypothetical protein MBH78_10445 [Oceanimonas sp. NS1]|nr:hypothetical protein [Oceanimonas sp. NS1]
MFYAAFWPGFFARNDHSAGVRSDRLYLFGLDALSEELEEPFGLAANDLPLTAMSRAIEISLLEALDVTELPPAIEPENGYLQ